jgi:transcriptional regulator with XRE-family HTH domain
MRLQYGKLKKLAESTSLSRSYLSMVISRQKNISISRAKELSDGCRQIGVDLSENDWAFGDSELLKSRIGAE